MRCNHSKLGIGLFVCLRRRDTTLALVFIVFGLLDGTCSDLLELRRFLLFICLGLVFGKGYPGRNPYLGSYGVDVGRMRVDEIIVGIR